MESRYIKLDYEEAISAKKDILSSEMEILKIARTIENFKQLRKKELQLKTRLKTLMTELRTKLSAVESSFPEEFGKIRIKTRKNEKKETPKTMRIQDELEDIRAKLARLQ